MDTYGIALDIGTTTLDMSLVRLDDGKVLAEKTALNPQRKSGQDVLTRVLYEQRFGKIAIRRMQELVVGAINEMIVACCDEAGIRRENISEIVVAANCVMAHLLLGVDASAMGQAPYQPAFTDAQSVKAKDIGIEASEDTMLYTFPHVAAFFGGDVVAGAWYCGLEENTLFVDIGTNGELALFGHDGIVACSCAVGPALEGMNISCGMVAGDGAIETVDIEAGGNIRLHVIGDAPPRGLCGSGVLSVIQKLLENGRMDETGLLTDGRKEVILDKEHQISFTQKDIRQVQLAKGAILAAIRTLMEKAKLPVDDISKVFVAGQFGAHLPEELLTDVGIFPREMRGKLIYLGNTAKKSAIAALLSEEARGEIETLAQKIEYIELADTDVYMQYFVEGMNF